MTKKAGGGGGGDVSLARSMSSLGAKSEADVGVVVVFFTLSPAARMMLLVENLWHESKTSDKSSSLDT